SRVEGANDVAYRAHGAGAARAVFPAEAAEFRLYRLELETRREPRSLEALGGYLAVAEEALAPGPTAHLQALELERIQSFSDDELGAATTDVDHESFTRLAWHGVRDTGVNEACLLHAGDDLDRVTEGVACALEKSLLLVRETQGVGPDDAHAVGVHVAQALPE